MAEGYRMWRQLGTIGRMPFLTRKPSYPVRVAPTAAEVMRRPAYLELAEPAPSRYQDPNRFTYRVTDQIEYPGHWTLYWTPGAEGPHVVERLIIDQNIAPYLHVRSISAGVEPISPHAWFANPIPATFLGPQNSPLLRPMTIWVGMDLTLQVIAATALPFGATVKANRLVRTPFEIPQHRQIVPRRRP